MTALILVVFLGAAVIAIPIAHALLVAAMAAAAASDRVPLDLLVQQMVAQVQSFPLIAIPFFMLTGSLMMGGRLGEALIGLLSVLLGRYHGGPLLIDAHKPRYQIAEGDAYSAPHHADDHCLDQELK